MPAPRPPIYSQVVQSPGGGNCSGRAQNSQHDSAINASSSLRLSRNAFVAIGSDMSMLLARAKEQLAAVRGKKLVVAGGEVY